MDLSRVIDVGLTVGSGTVAAVTLVFTEYMPDPGTIQYALGLMATISLITLNVVTVIIRYRNRDKNKE